VPSSPSAKHTVTSAAPYAQAANGAAVREPSSESMLAASVGEEVAGMRPGAAEHAQYAQSAEHTQHPQPPELAQPASAGVYRPSCLMPPTEYRLALYAALLLTHIYGGSPWIISVTIFVLTGAVLSELEMRLSAG
jgi:hypothetical protein